MIDIFLDLFVLTRAIKLFLINAKINHLERLLLFLVPTI